MLYTYTSLTRWGAFLEGRTVSGVGEACHLEEHIHRLEMRAVLLSLRHFQEVIQEQCLLIATDNTTVVVFLQNQGETHSLSLYLLCREIILLCDSLQTVLTVRHVPGNQNLIADVKTILVSCSHSVVCKTASSSLERGPSVSIQGKEASSRAGETPSARMVAVRTYIRHRGFSEKATKRITGKVWVNESEWLLLYANSAIVQLCHGENKLIYNEMKFRFVLDQHDELDFIVLAHWNNSPHVAMSPHSDTLFWFRVNQSLLFLLKAVWLEEKQQMPIL